MRPEAQSVSAYGVFWQFMQLKTTQQGGYAVTCHTYILRSCASCLHGTHTGVLVRTDEHPPSPPSTSLPTDRIPVSADLPVRLQHGAAGAGQSRHYDVSRGQCRGRAGGQRLQLGRRDGVCGFYSLRPESVQGDATGVFNTLD